MFAAENWYNIQDIELIDTPALIIYPQRVKANINTLVTMIDAVDRLRPHVKTNKCNEAVLMMMEAGITKFKSATIAEAEMLAICGAADVLLAYQPVGPKLQRFVALIKNYPETKFSCLTDAADAARSMANVFSSNHLNVPVYLDINLGMNRTGIVPDTSAIQLYKTCASLEGIIPVGLHAYDGHIRDTDFELRSRNCDAAFSLVELLQTTLTALGFSEPIIIAGGSPTFPIHAKRKHIECSPGTFIFWDKGYSKLCPEQHFLTAALVISRVISLPDATKICMDLGHKSIASENEIGKRVQFLNAPELKPISQSEEHLVLEAGAGHGYNIGDVLYGLPYHICPTVALYEKATTIENNIVNGAWRIIARNRQIEC